MSCPICKNDECEVLEKRQDRRRRRCKRCGHRFTTYEVSEAELERLRAVEAKARDLAAAVESG